MRLKLAIVNTEAASWQFWKGQPTYMRARGIECHCISSGGPLLDQFALTEQVAVHAINVERSVTPWSDLRAIFLLATKLREIKAQVVQGDTSKSGLLAMIAGTLARVPARIYRNHGMALSSSRGTRRILLWWCEKLSCCLAHEVIYVSPSVKDAAIREGVCPPRKATVVLSANGLDTAGKFDPANLAPEVRVQVRMDYGIPANASVLGYVGRLFRVKGIVELADAWEELSQIYPGLHLLVAGAFDTRDPVPRHVERQLRSDPRIHLAGYVESTAPLLAAMDLLILPSFHEGLGYALIEASAMNIPVIGTRIPGIVDAVKDGVTGTLVEPGDVAAIIESVSRYLENPELRTRHGEAGRRYVVQAFQQKRVWDELYQHYTNLARAKGIETPEESSCR